MKKQHLNQGASSFERWSACPGSLGLTRTRQSDDATGSKWSREGDVAHEILENCLRQGLSATEQTDDIEMAAAVDNFLDIVQPIRDNADVEYIEQTLEPSGDLTEWGGTVDYAAVTGSNLFVVDFKSGAHVHVTAYVNRQLGTYAQLLRRLHPEVTKVQLCIVQPRRNNVSTWHSPLEWLDGVEESARIAASSSHFSVGPHCCWCPASDYCPEVVAKTKIAVAADIDCFTLSELADMFRQLPQVRKKLATIPEKLTEAIMSGHTVPGIKVVRARKVRKFKSDPQSQEAIASALPEAAEPFKKTALSPAQFEKAGGNIEDVAHLIDNSLGDDKYTVTTEDDRRPEVDFRSDKEIFEDG